VSKEDARAKEKEEWQEGEYETVVATLREKTQFHAHSYASFLQSLLIDSFSHFS
jgi:hypothetical protein